MRKLRISMLLVALVSVFTLGLLACGSDEPEPTTAPPQPTTPPPTAVPEPTATPEPEMMMMEVKAGFTRVMVPPHPVSAPADPAGGLESDQTLIVVIPSKRSSIAPWREGFYARMFQPNVFMPPFRFDPDFNIVQGFALAYDYNDAHDTFIIHIDPEAIFHDGTPVTAADVKKAWEVGSWPENQVSWGASLLYLRSVEGIDAVEKGDATEASGLTALDDHTLEIELTGTKTTFPIELALSWLGIFKPDFDDPEWQLHPIGAGPFTAKLDPDTGLIEVERADNWWGEKPTLEKLEISNVPDTQTQLVMFENGEVDAIYADQIRQPSLHTDPNHPLREHLEWIKGVGWHAFGFDQNQAPFEDMKVRAAMSHAVDMESAVKAVFGQTAERAVGLMPRTMPCYRGDTAYEFDVDLAKKLLSESTYGSADKLPSIVVADSRPAFIRLYEVLQEQWKDNLGVTVSIVQLERGQDPPENRNMPTNNHTWGYNDPSQPLTDEGHPESSAAMNQTHHQNAELAALIDAANQMSLDDPGRCAAYQKAEDIIIDNYYWLPIKQNNDVRAYLVQPWIAGWNSGPQDEINTLDKLKIGKREK